jgi:MFS family permease
MQTTLAALAVITVGYILAYLVFDRLRDRFGYVGGAEYVIIGFLLGPRMTGLLGAAEVQDLTPIVSLALGWLGMLLGTYFRLPALARIDPSHLRFRTRNSAGALSLCLGICLA